MTSAERLLICGASARAAAFSARRAGLLPWCADLFADADLRLRFPVRQLGRGDYPGKLVHVLRGAPLGPWIYTGALENHPTLVQTLARIRPLWGNDGPILRRVRSPAFWTGLLQAAGLSAPAVCFPGHNPPVQSRWLIKPLHGAAGRGIHFWDGATPLSPGTYLQEYQEGEARAAIFLADRPGVRLLGTTRQLVGESWLHARPFAYCGSIGPLPLDPPLQQTLEKLGETLACGLGLRGLFGVDFVLREGTPWPVEVNPRYTASVEILEYGLGVPALALHGRIFSPELPLPPGPGFREGAFLGKAVLYAPAPLAFPTVGPWERDLQQAREASPWNLPSFADIPAAGEPIKAGWPVLTFFARAGSVSGCREELRRVAGDLKSWLWKK